MLSKKFNRIGYRFKELTVAVANTLAYSEPYLIFRGLQGFHHLRRQQLQQRRSGEYLFKLFARL
jgi:hypothetical protein